jgi:pimeloyl-ACP methyl ester carboxylesterase
MPTTSIRRLWGCAVLAVSLVFPLGVVTATPANAADRTSSTEARRVDRVRTPKITWVEDEARGGYTGSVKVPLDYDRPSGSKVTIALFKVPAADPSARIGTLFLNPGGPGASGVDMAASATTFLSQSVLDRFDVVGFDPRGTNASTEVTCFPSPGRQSAALSGLTAAFPGPAEQAAYIASAQRLGAACSTYGVKLASAMSTAQVARDLDVLRRAVGDRKLTYLGFSYGSYLGQVYANLFPDRFRALAVDGVIDPVAWAGTTLTRSVPAGTRVKAAEASWSALVAGLAACAAAGPERCPLPDPQADFDAVADRLKAQPLTVGVGGAAYSYRYQDFISDTLSLLYYPEGMDYVAQLVAALKQLVDAGTGTAPGAAAGDRAARLIRAFRHSLAAYDARYDNDLEAYSGVLCTDAYEPSTPASWVLATAKASVRAPHFGQLWGWTDVQCATSTWKARDEDAYHGSFSRNTAATVLLVGNYHDPATNYAGALEASTLLPNSVLLRSDSWGHTAYATSDCVTDRVDAYLLTGKVRGDTATTVCTGDVQPFSQPLGAGSGTATGAGTASKVEVPSREGLPPVEVAVPRERA